jgi:hypothetical protein
VNQVGSSAQESNPPDTASKKRAGSRQISKDDDPDLEIAVAVQSGTFRKASDAVLANQRIVKVRRTGTTVGGGGVGGGGGGTSAPNPFASIRLVPSVASASDEGVAPPPQPAPDLTSDPSETIVALEKGDETEVPAKESDQPPTEANLQAKNDTVAIEVSCEEKLGLGLQEQSKALATTGRMARQVLDVLWGLSVQVQKHSSSFLLQKILFLARLGLDSPHQLSHPGAHRHQQPFLLLVLPLGQG